MPSPWLTIDRRRDMYLNIKTYHIYIAVYIIYIIYYLYHCMRGVVTSNTDTKIGQSGVGGLMVCWSRGTANVMDNIGQ